jgi:hypothetical protein
MAPERSNTWKLVIIAAAAFVIGALLGAAVVASTGSEGADEILSSSAEVRRMRLALDNADERIWKLFRERESLQAQLDQLAETGSGSQVPNPAVEPGVLGDGIHIVGEDVAPGEYEGEPTEDVGYWARLKNTDGTVNSVVANGLVTGPFVVKVVESDKALELRGVRLQVE